MSVSENEKPNALNAGSQRVERTAEASEELTRVQKTEEKCEREAEGEGSLGSAGEQYNTASHQSIAYVNMRALMRARRIRTHRHFLYVMRYNYNLYRSRLNALYREHINNLRGASAADAAAENESYKNKLLLAGAAYKSAAESLNSGSAAFADMSLEGNIGAQIGQGVEMQGSAPVTYMGEEPVTYTDEASASYPTEEPITLGADGYYVYTGEGAQPLEAQYPDPQSLSANYGADSVDYRAQYPDPQDFSASYDINSLDYKTQYPDPQDYSVDAAVEYYGGADAAPDYEQEYPEFFSENEKKESDFSFSNTQDTAFVAERVEQSVRLVEERMLYEIEDMKHRHKMLAYTFTTDSYKKESSSRRMANGVDKRIKKLERAKRLERLANKRYYLAATDKAVCSATRRAKREVEISSVLRRLNFLLDERARIDDRLIQLYTGSSKMNKKTYGVYANKKARRVARRAYKSQRKLAKKVSRLHATLKLKDKIFALMNERTLEYAKIENSLCKLRKGDKSLSRELKRDIKKSKKKIVYLKSDIKYFIKKAEKEDNKHRANKEQAIWLISLLAAALVIGGVYLAFKSAIDAFFASLFGG